MLKPVTVAVAALAFSALLPQAAAFAQDHRTPAPEGAEVYFISPKDGDTVKSPFKVTFGLKGMGVAPAGVEKEKTGHHHLLIDQKLEDYNSAIPSDETHRHFGGGQTETMVELTPGTHTLQLLLGDMNHVPFDPSVESPVITVTVE
ncbi:DUF4399 domain-containing protein [Stappia sp.]|jgi:hypothetical protein|uniref:DUF4399 domain-containing protein n=1 Tax=Stappia sp. TaxID=1870903 RepID=UPI003A99562D